MVTLLRSVLNLAKIQQMNSQNAIVIRDTPDKVAAAAKILRTIDKAKPEVLIHVQVLTANRDRLRDLGILPGQSVAVTFTPRGAAAAQHQLESAAARARLVRAPRAQRYRCRTGSAE